MHQVKLPLFAFVLVAFAATSALAQQWPITFRGQPEFDFKRDNLIQEMQVQKRAGRGRAKEGADLLPTITSLLQRGLIDPFATEKEQQEAPAEQININLPQLPDLTASDQLNLDEFRNYLHTIINTAHEGQVFDFSDYDFTKDLGRIVLQSVIAAPSPYVMINNKKFSPGDRFLLPVNVKLDSTDKVEETIYAQMPEPDSVSETAYQQYQEYRDEALREYREKKDQLRKSKTNDGRYNISVTVKEIKHRAVVVSVAGRDYELRMGV
ncbi:MAG: hypothetical protein GC134_08890 [Proteobacteria bacterium]|nr:hypothetical protein [Pseudomonadota bacterium]